MLAVRDIVTIRAERPADFDVIRELVRLAFLDAEHAEGDEHDFVDRQRAGPGYLPDLALVAEARGDGVVGHIMLTRIDVRTPGGDSPMLLLAELAVAAPFRRRGIASRLIERVFAYALDAGHAAILLVGDPDFYAQFGFRPSIEHGLDNGNGIESRYVLSCALCPDGLALVSGVVDLPH